MEINQHARKKKHEIMRRTEEAIWAPNAGVRPVSRFPKFSKESSVLRTRKLNFPPHERKKIKIMPLPGGLESDGGVPNREKIETSTTSHASSTVAFKFFPRYIPTFIFISSWFS